MATGNKDKTRPGRWKKGESGNPNGRPKLPEEIRDAARAASPKAIQVLVDIMSSDEANQGERIKAAIAILNRAYGTPPQSVEVTGKEGEPLAIKIEYVSKKE